MYDIAIVGAGPAGATLARILGASHSVLLADKRPAAEACAPHAPGGSKLCGGLLAPAAQKELARQELGLPRELLVGPQLFAVRSVDGDSGLERRYQRHYVNIDRLAFDGWLTGLAAKVADYRPGWRLDSLELAGPNPLLRFETAEGGRAACTARLVVGADGAASLIRRTLGFAAPTRYIAMQAEFTAEGGESSYGAYFDRQLTDHYAWSIPKAGSVLVGAALPSGPGTTKRFNAIVEKMRIAGFGLGEESARSAAPVVRPQRLSDIALGRRSVALLGEAAGLISPSSAEGVSYALRSAAVLARAIEVELRDPVAEYRRLARPLVGEVAGKAVKARLLSSSTFRAAVMLSG
ncbi:MAG TPA: oxidoreductase, partial [Coriobacteriia bacterium]|nr:oxidoreductase [Coriobacteriia bacterium]